MQQRYTQAADFWRERDFGQKISAAFDFIGVHWRPLGRVLLYFAVPAALVHAMLNAVIQSQMLHALQRPLYGPAGTSRLAALSTTFTSPLYYGSNAVGVASFSVLLLSIYGYVLLCVYPPVPGAEIRPADVGAIIRRKFVGTFFSLYGVGLLVLFGSIVFLLPGIYLSVVLSLFFIVNMVEDSNFATTISRCLALTKGKWWSTFGLILVMVALLYLLLIGVGIVLGLLGASLRGVFASADLSGTGPSTLAIVVTGLSTLLMLLLYPPILLALAFQYFNLVELHEGVGMRQLVSQLGQAPTAGPDASTYRPTEEGEY